MGKIWHARTIAELPPKKNEGREIRTPNLLIWSQTRYRCAIPPLGELPSLIKRCSSTNKKKLNKLKEYGANVLIDTSSDNWLDDVLKATNGEGVDILIDMLSGDYVNKNMEATKIHGHVINIGRLAGMSGNFNYDLHAKRRLNYVGTTGRTRSLEENEMVAKLANNDLWASVLAGNIRHVIYSKMHLTKAKEALDIMNKNSHFGKIILFTDEFTNKDNIVN